MANRHEELVHRLHEARNVAREIADVLDVSAPARVVRPEYLRNEDIAALRVHVGKLVLALTRYEALL